MKVWLLAGLFTIAAAPAAFASEGAIECQTDETRRETAARVEAPAAPAALAQPVIVARDCDEPPPRQAAERRRNGKRIPDAELIGPRGAL